MHIFAHMFSRGVKYMIAATFCFSMMQVGVKYLRHIPFHELILFRSIITLLISFIILARLKIHPLGHNRKVLLQRGIYGTLALSMLFLSIQHLPLASAATLSYLSPIFTAIFAIFLLREKVAPVQWLFFTAAFTGVVLIKGFDSNVDIFYVIVAVCGALFAGLAYNMVRKLKDTDHPVVVVFYFPLVATPIMLLWCLFDWVAPVGWDWAVIIAIGLLAQFGQVYMSKALHAEKAAPITSIKFLGTANALVFSIFLFRETYTYINVLGILMVTAGVMLNIYYSHKHGTA
jgi:drug/metabolite transporter (DMT)-like permease